MSWLEQWRALSMRIEGLMRAGDFVSSALKVNASDPSSVVKKSLIPEFQAITNELEEFEKSCASELPSQAEGTLKAFLQKKWSECFHSNNVVVNVQILASLAVFRSQFDYLVRDSEIEMRNLAELAFQHLRRLIVVDPDAKKKWTAAFQKHETACERLGAVQLLNHGIWAFKVTATGGATDLVFSDPLQQYLGIITRTARTLVLTEWKLVKTPGDLEAKAKEGRSQVTSYSSGVLGNTELKGTRYIVLVTKSDLPSPNDVVQGNIMYRHIVIPVQPESPSEAARKKSRSRKND